MPVTIAEVLRQAIRASGTSTYALSRKSGVAQSVLSRFLRGKSGLTLTTAARLAAALDLDLAPHADAALAVAAKPTRARRSRTHGRPIDLFFQELRDGVEATASMLVDKHLTSFVSSDSIDYRPTRVAVLADMHVGVSEMVSSIRRLVMKHSKSAARTDAVWGKKSRVGRNDVVAACDKLLLPPPPPGQKVDERRLKAVFRELAKAYHPDTHGGESTTAQFLAVKGAYQLLRDYNDDIGRQ